MKRWQMDCLWFAENDADCTGVERVPFLVGSSTVRQLEQDLRSASGSRGTTMQFSREVARFLRSYFNLQKSCLVSSALMMSLRRLDSEPLLASA